VALPLLRSTAVAVFFTTAAHAQSTPVRWTAGAEVAGYLDSDHVAVLTPSLRASARAPTSGWSADGSYLVDVVSAASVDVVSAASPRWTEVRHAGALAARYKPRALGVGVRGATSVEPDFVSWVAGLEGSADLARKNAVLALGYSFEHDVAGRKGTPFSVYALRLDRHELSARVELVLDRATVFTPSFDLGLESGRQEKPYRWLPLFDAATAPRVPVGAPVEEVDALRLPARVTERLPETRQRYALSGRLAHRFEQSTLVLWDRAYLDSWGLRSSSSDLRWTFELSRRWSLWPHLRFHVQSGVSFWERAYVGSVNTGSVSVPEFRSGDRELGPLWSATAGPGVRFDVGGADPRSLSMTLEIEGSYTNFEDALYIDHRWSGFGVAGFSVRFE